MFTRKSDKETIENSETQEIREDPELSGGEVSHEVIKKYQNDDEAAQEKIKKLGKGETESTWFFFLLTHPLVLLMILLLIGTFAACYLWYILTFQRHVDPPIVVTSSGGNVVLINPTQRNDDKTKTWTGEIFISPILLYPQAVPDRKVSIIVYDIGLDSQVTDMFLDEMPPEVDFAFSPYTPDLDVEIDLAKQMGHTSPIITIPLEMNDHKTHDLGRLTLRTGMINTYNLGLIEKIMQNAPDVHYVLFKGGDLFLASYTDLNPVIHALKGKHLTLITPPDCLLTQVHKISQEHKMLLLPSIIDLGDVKESDLNDTLNKTIETINHLGEAIILVPAKISLLKPIIEWINRLNESKLTLVSVTQTHMD